MKKFNKILFQLPEYYILIVVMLSGYSVPFNFNPIAIGLGVVVLLQIIFKNRMTGLFIATLFLLINIYMPFALLSEFRNFGSVNRESMQLLLTGFSLIIFNLFFAALMIYKYLEEEGEKESVLGDAENEKKSESIERKVMTNSFLNSDLSDKSGRATNSVMN